MRGSEPQQMALFSVVSLEARITADHPLTALSPTFDQIYAGGGRPSIPPEHLLRALLHQVLYTVRRERQLMEQLEYNRARPLRLERRSGLSRLRPLGRARRQSPAAGPPPARLTLNGAPPGARAVPNWGVRPVSPPSIVVPLPPARAAPPSSPEPCSFCTLQLISRAQNRSDAARSRRFRTDTS